MAPTPSIRIAVLEADTPIGKTKETYGGYGNLFKELLRNGAKRYSESKGAPAPDLDVSKYDVVNTEVYPDLEAVDAVLISGSKWNSYDNDPWILKLVAFTRTILAQSRVRLIGVCFGHQIIGRALDVKVARSDKGWETSVTTVQLTAKGQEIFGGVGKELHIHQMHRDIIYTLPPSIHALGSSPRCEVQGMYAPRRLISVQGHPEFNGDIVTELLENRHRMGIFDDGMFEDGMRRVREKHDGVAIAGAFIGFLEE